MAFGNHWLWQYLWESGDREREKEKEGGEKEDKNESIFMAIIGTNS